jgi:hypothetical protein
VADGGAVVGGVRRNRLRGFSLPLAAAVEVGGCCCGGCGGRGGGAGEDEGDGVGGTAEDCEESEDCDEPLEGGEAMEGRGGYAGPCSNC